ncbi:MAG TPA: COX aromatic rich motif-containing protein [Acidisoma sp.]|nr:COX aromatic rich motif-containing protein [Acidisoma sp.]
MSERALSGKRRALRVLRCRSLILLPTGLSLSGCTVLSRGFLAPGGPIAGAERHEFIIVGIVLLFVAAPVFLLTPLIAWHYRLANTKSAFRPNWGFSWILEVLIWVPPTLIVIGLSVLLWGNTVRLDPYRRLPAAMGKPLDIDVVALDWKWLFIYPAQHIATVDQLVVPAGRPVHFALTSGTVMQSLLMPQLAGQIYAMAGMRTQLNFLVRAPATYWGENTQFNGDGFQNQKFQINAITPGSFADWVGHARADPRRLDDAAYTDLSRQSTLNKPMTFGSIEDGIFQRILHQQITPGYAIQHQEAKPHA